MDPEASKLCSQPHSTIFIFTSVDKRNNRACPDNPILAVLPTR